MSKEEKIFLGLAIVGLVAVILLQRPRNVIVSPVNPAGDPVTEIGVSLTPNNDSVVKGPSYLVYNTPWMFAPPIGNFLPSITAGIGSQTVNQPTNFDNDCGCY